MKKLIELDAAIKATWKDTGYTDPLNVMTAIRDRIEALPTVDAVQVRHGHWIERESGTEDKENGFATVIVCSCCDFPATTFYSEDCESRTQIRTDFCPHCGAKMDGKDGDQHEEI